MSDTDTSGGLISTREILRILYRRRYWLLVPAVAGLLLSIAAVLLARPQYRSSTSLLITSQQIPTSFVAATSANYAEERIATIRQQITSRANLASLVVAHNLYPQERRKVEPDDVLDLMRQAIGVDLVGTSQNNANGTGGNTIAFKLSFTYRDPVVAQTITQKLTKMFLLEDKRLRTEQADSTAAFLGRRARELRDRLDELSLRRRQIEDRYAGAMPEQVAANAQSSAALRAEVSRIDAESQALVQQNGLLAARTEEIAAAPNPNTDSLRRAEDRLAQLRTVYSENFPDVVAARDLVDRQRKEAAGERARRPGGGVVAVEMTAARSRMAALAARRAQLVDEIAQVERLSALAPQASYELNNAERDYENLRLQYQGIRDKQMEAQVAANLQIEDKGERFSVVDPPNLPFAPLGPGRNKMLAMGVIGGFGLGLLLVLAWELSVQPVHGEDSVARVLGVPPMVTIPVLPRETNGGVIGRVQRWVATLLPGFRRGMVT